MCDKPDDSIDSSNFSVRDYLPLIQKGLIFIKLCRCLLMFSTGFTSLSVLLLFPLLIHSLSLCTVFHSVSSNIDAVLSIYPSANIFVFGDFNVHHKDWLTYSGGTDRSGELCYNFSIANNPTHIVNFPTQIQDVILTVLLFWISFFLLMLVFVLQSLSLHWVILIILLSQFLLTFHQIHHGMPRFIAYLMIILLLIGTVFVII